MAAQAAGPHYVVCNADESEPGTFKDRVLLEGDPFAVVEAMTIAAYATGASLGYLYLRGEYPEAEARVRAATDAARAAGLLGPDIMGSGFAFDIELRRGAGAEEYDRQVGEAGIVADHPRHRRPVPVRQAGRAQEEECDGTDDPGRDARADSGRDRRGRLPPTARRAPWPWSRRGWDQSCSAPCRA